MNKKLFLIPLVGVASLTAAAAFASNQTPSQPLPAIGFDRAVEIAIEAHPGTVSETEYEREDGRDVVVVEIKTSDGTMEVTIDAADGAIITSELDDDDDDDDDHDD